MERQYFTYVQEEIGRDTSKNLAQKRRVDKSGTFVHKTTKKLNRKEINWQFGRTVMEEMK